MRPAAWRSSPPRRRRTRITWRETDIPISWPVSGDYLKMLTISKYCTRLSFIGLGGPGGKGSNPDMILSPRYRALLSVDHTRVRVKGSSQHGGKEKDEYFNANFVDGFRRSKAYIATQGPMQSTQNLFWRMVFEQNVKIIVMITHLYEGGKVRLSLKVFQSSPLCSDQV